jgi:hypothetical protein
LWFKGGLFDCPGNPLQISVIRVINGKVLPFRSSDHARSPDQPIFFLISVIRVHQW